MRDQTIFALSSGAGKAGIAVIRVSGSAALLTLGRLTGLTSPTTRRAHRVKITKPETMEIIDDGLALYFPAPNSFTGEDVVEFHLHGSRAVLKETSSLLIQDPNVRLAEPGEFTRRAFDNGKLDLTAAEGLADLVNAETTAQRRQAQRQLRGELANLYGGWRERLLRAIALFEAEIDFSDEDLPSGLRDQVDKVVEKLEAEISSHLSDSARGRLVRDGFYIAIVGPPNAGKSSLLNRLAQRDVAIVSEKAGTTRDVIEVHMDLGGFAVILADTAGLRDASGGIEIEGVARSLERANSADLRLAVFDGSKWPELDAATLEVVAGGNTLSLVNKTDLGFNPTKDHKNLTPLLGVSAKTGKGLDELLAKLTNDVSERCQLSADPTITKTRYITALKECVISLERYKSATLTELAAEDLRLAARSIGRITGQVNVEEVLGLIFEEFCIGK